MPPDVPFPARSAADIATIQEAGLPIAFEWCGAGSNTPSQVQIELIRTLKFTIGAGTASYAQAAA